MFQTNRILFKAIDDRNRTNAVNWENAFRRRIC